tara:strand:- start:2954 stop:4162 length:1209 start_codon:yes stop_codon:yes gene_type:complete
MNKNILMFLTGLLIAIMLVANVSALGVTPARTTVDFEPGLKRSVVFSVINSERRDVDIVIAVQGELKNNILLQSAQSFSMTSAEESRQVAYDLSLPATMKPGLHTGEVVILQLPDEIGTSEAFIGAALAVVTQVYVYVPYPGKYAEASMNIINANAGEDVTFIIPVVSRGEFDLVSVKANIDIYNKVGEKIDSFNTNEISVPSSKRREIVHKWKSDVFPGIYRAVATLIYDGETIQLEKVFNIGNQELELQQIEVNDFSLGEIAKMEMLVENKWSEPIQGAFARTNIYNDRGELMADFKSPSYDIPALTKKVLVSYWDTAGVRTGTYNSKIFLKYADKSVQTDLQLKVEQNRIEIIGLGYVISEDSRGGSGNTLMIVLVIGIVVLILVNLLWFFLLRKRLKR